MLITFSPRRQDGVLSLSLTGEVLVLNGTEIDLGRLAEGDVLPAEACVAFAGPATRRQGRIEVALCLPHGADAPETVRFPAALTVVADGPILAPGLSLHPGEPVTVDWSTLQGAETLAETALAAARARARAALLARIEALVAALTGRVPLAEMLSWGPKEAAARAWLAASATPGDKALIEGEAAVTGEDPDALVVRILANADTYRAAVAALTGLRRKGEAAIAAAMTDTQVAEVEQAISGQIAALSA
jgi:hypothetical protein